MWNKIQRIYIGSNLVRPNRKDKYQEVEYIQSSWTQYIDTNLLVNWDFTTEAKYAKTTNVAWNTLFGTRNWTYCRYLVRCNSDASYFTVQRSYSSANTNTIETYESGNYYNNNIHTVKLNKYLYVDNTLLKTYKTSTTTNLFSYKLYVFALNSSWTASDYWYYKLYYMKIRDDSNNLVRNFVPCYRKSDNVIWLYDLVDNQFYTNSWTWTFTKWPDVN